MTTLLKTRPVQARSGHSQLNTLLRSVAPDEMGGLADHSRIRKVAAGEELMAAGVRNSEVFFPQTAIISHVYFAESGGSVETSLIGPEGASGLSTLFHRKASRHFAIVTVAGDVLCIRASDLVARMATNGALRGRLSEYLASQVSDTGQRLACSVFHLAEERLCTWLLMLRERAGSNKMRVTHEEIANLLGVNRTSVSSIAKRLKNKGIVDYIRGKLHILDVTGLQAAACDCYPSLCEPMASLEIEASYERNSAH